ncbi:FAD binding domain-containing protein [Nguyenibacter sp. L1]|uniref:FAD binding domain-containing protein n=1 Tax=Nguyenibacter sp. L1 TaxID=3049350 RepID=UPI002B482270|nr:FAD binding domain-containing protein [Nguyenibacter sp. L1]WRH89135.1 FAD binding domain-containing protein [Nguyenibacter sp. L1]
MKPAPFSYHRLQTVAELVGLTARLGDAAVILAGGQSLVPMLNLRLSRPEHVIDVNDIVEMDHLLPERDGLRIGALVRHQRVAESAVVAAHMPLLGRMAGGIGNYAVRQRGTIGGSLVLADPAAHMPLAALLFDARLVLRSTLGVRTAAYRDLYRSPLNCALGAGEVVVSVWFPRQPETMRAAVEMVHVTAGSFPALICAVRLIADAQGGLAALTVVVAAGAVRPPVLDSLFDDLRGARPDAVLQGEVTRRVAAHMGGLIARDAAGRYLLSVLEARMAACLARVTCDAKETGA